MPYKAIMRKFSPTPRQIFDVVSQVTGIAPEELRSESEDEKVTRAQDWAFFFSRIWTGASYARIGEETGISADENRVITGISEASKILYSDVYQVREALQFSREAGADFRYYSIKLEDKTSEKVCEAFMNAGNGYEPGKHGPYAETMALFGRLLIRVNDYGSEPLVTVKPNAVNVVARWVEKYNL